jgi:hypothetical protein
MQLVCMYVDVAGLQLSTRATSGTDTAERGNMPQILVKWLMGASFSASPCHCACCLFCRGVILPQHASRQCEEHYSADSCCKQLYACACLLCRAHLLMQPHHVQHTLLQRR